MSDADLLMGPLQADGHEFYSRTLLSERYVCVMDRANPLAEQPLALEQYVAAPHATVTYGGTWRSRYLLQLDTLGQKAQHGSRGAEPGGAPRR
jgi:DNA-binding transcriptional LysR family regulator